MYRAVGALQPRSTYWAQDNSDFANKMVWHIPAEATCILNYS